MIIIELKRRSIVDMLVVECLQLISVIYIKWDEMLTSGTLISLHSSGSLKSREIVK